MAQFIRGPARRAGDPGSNPGPGENFSHKLLITDIFLNQKRVNVHEHTVKIAETVPWRNIDSVFTLCFF